MQPRKGFMPFRAKVTSDEAVKDRKETESEIQILRETISKKDAKIGNLASEVEKQSDDLFELQDEVNSLKQRLLLSEEKQQKLQNLVDSLKEKIEAEKITSRQNENKLRKAFETKIRQTEETAELRVTMEERKVLNDTVNTGSSSDLVNFLESAHVRINELEALLLGQKKTPP